MGERDACRGSGGWLLKTVIVVGSSFAVLGLALVGDVFFGVELPAYGIGLVSGAAVAIYLNRGKLLAKLDPESTAARARNTASLMSESQRD